MQKNVYRGGVRNCPERTKLFHHVSFIDICSSVQLSSLQFKMVSMRSGKPICAPPRLTFASVTKVQSGGIFPKRDGGTSSWRYRGALAVPYPLCQGHHFILITFLHWQPV